MPLQCMLQPKGIITRRWETIQVALLLLILLTVFFWKAIFLGYKLLPADIIYTDPIYLSYAPPDFKEPHNPLLYDQIYQFYPWRVYTGQALQRGFLPLWNPYIYSGAPFIATDQPAVFYPLNVLSYVFPAVDAFLFLALARLLIAGVTSYWFVRTIGGDNFGALLSAISFAFSGLMIVWLGHPHTNVVAWLPALFLTVEWLYQKNNPQHVVFVALVVATQLTGGHVVLCLYAFTAAGLYYLFRIVSAWWRERRLKPLLNGLLSLSIAIVLGFALASIHLLPFWEWVQQSAELQLRSGAKSARVMRIKPQYWLAGVLLAILPNLFNNPTWPGIYRSFLPVWNFAEQTLYVGIIPLALAIMASIVRRHEKKVVFLAVLGIAALGAALQWPIFGLVNYLPLFNIAASGRFRLVYTFCVSVLAGLGARDLTSHDRRNPFTHAVIWLLTGFLVLSVLALLVVRFIIRAMATDPSWMTARQLSQDFIQWAFSISNVGMYWPVFVALAGILALVLYCCRVLKQRMMQIIVLLLVVLDLFAFGMGYHTTIQQERIFPETPALRLIKSDKSLFRVIGTDTHLMPNACMVYGFYDVRGLDFPGYRYLELCRAMGGQDWLGYGILFTEPLQTRLLNLLNVKYVLTSSNLDPTLWSNMVLLYVDKNIHVYQNLGCLPRSFIVHRARVADDAQEELMLLQAADFDPGTEIVLEKSLPPGMVTSLNTPAQEVTEITRYEPNHVTILASTPVSGFLFLSDSYYVGWKAYVDGVETDIYRADYAFRAVYLPPGQHTVDFVYEPQSFKVAALIALLALLGIVVLLVGSRLLRAGAVRNSPEGNGN